MTSLPTAPVSPADRARVSALLGREPLGRFDVVVRDLGGDPVVIRNAPVLDDGTPMPTRYWLVGQVERRVIGAIEADGGVRRAEAEIDPSAIARCHEAYRAERDAAFDALVDRPGARRPAGGVGGTRVGVKCLHAHYASYLAGNDDPIGRWVRDRLVERDAERVVVVVGDTGRD